MITIPTTLGLGRCRVGASRIVHQCPHALNRCLDASVNSFADQKMTNIEFDNRADRGNVLDRIKRDAVPGVALQPQLRGNDGGGLDSLEFEGSGELRAFSPLS